MLDIYLGISYRLLRVFTFEHKNVKNTRNNKSFIFLRDK